MDVTTTAALGVPDPQNAGPGPSTGDGAFAPFGRDGFTFSDLLDIVNPLQHIPIVSAIYRHVTGDTIDPASRIIGGTLFGGPVGTVAAITDTVIEESTGRDMGEHAFAFFESDGAAETSVAQLAGPEDRAALSDELTSTNDVLAWARQEAAYAAAEPPATVAQITEAAQRAAAEPQGRASPHLHRVNHFVDTYGAKSAFTGAAEPLDLRI
ncbi:MAG: hypothetical protein OQK53_10570 [Rhodospirillales bacterium]|nr:hypothetical protein [Rhodospirillales bacterium]MCW8953133.1 hypothetical protein [Rhodospirillales bacterium]